MTKQAEIAKLIENYGLTESEAHTSRRSPMNTLTGNGLIANDGKALGEVLEVLDTAGHLVYGIRARIGVERDAEAHRVVRIARRLGNMVDYGTVHVGNTVYQVRDYDLVPT